MKEIQRESWSCSAVHLIHLIRRIRRIRRSGVSASSFAAFFRGAAGAAGPAVMVMALLPAVLAAQTPPRPIPLWAGKPPGAPTGNLSANDSVHLFAYPAAGDDNTGAAMVVCPGGGYGGLAMDHEGHATARYFAGRGINVFVLKYRLAAGGYRHPVPMNDAQRALRWVRAHAAEYGIDTARVGILGYSAGGHLASTAGTHYDDGNSQALDSVDRHPCRPAFMAPIYAVITMDASFTHGGSRTNLLGNNPSPDLVTLLSNEKQVTEDTPPTFLAHTRDDNVVPYRNSVEMDAACKAKGVPVKFLTFNSGPHGFGMADGKAGAPNLPELAVWPGELVEWLDSLGMLEGPPVALMPSPGQARPRAAVQAVPVFKRPGEINGRRPNTLESGRAF